MHHFIGLEETRQRPSEKKAIPRQDPARYNNISAA